MSEIFDTTMNPSKGELIAAWLPLQSWYGGARVPEFDVVGGFRLDDPAGEVGMEFIFITETSTGTPTTYQVPLAYRSAPCPEAVPGLLGTSEHGVLGTRWIYDGEHDPVLMAQVVELLEGRAVAQHQNDSYVLADNITVAPGKAVGATAPVLVRVLEPGTEAAGAGVIASWTRADGSTGRALAIAAG
ncbi:maltokinase N-terminal cap-like domain-containing protein [Paeniglutamicibacter cryotolerans]|uniref:Maltokinase N-terminal cap domain-containing protein n=1 Tax=Paeniglutamicibacter cryotolerans TaxID=670079 RepID=A0A839QMR4_9MICC|nr:1,4-alpha-glucan branching protein [Paeniglutamicibacter cryotolerans]MBB2996054.1 hypothetical protein [Paeniglutamicibacter cryotolerans]